jgi:xylulokinase
VNLSSRVVTGDFLLGIDLGTSSTKTVIMNPEGRVIASAAQEYGIEHPQPGHAEQDPEIWVQAAIKTIRTALSNGNIQAGQVAGIGISGQMHGTVCVGEDGLPVRPAIIWADQRSELQVARVNQQIGRERLGRWTANPLATGFMLATWLWLIENEPATLRQTRWLHLPKDYLRYRLTGRSGTEPSDASSTLLFDTAQRTWSEELLDALELERGLLPEIHESAGVAGGLSSEAAARCGLLGGTPVVYGGSDQALQALGHGIVRPGLISCTIGSGGVLFTPLESPLYDPHLRMHLFCHAVPDLWHLEAAILSAGLSLTWLRDSLFPNESFASLADAAAQAQPGAEGLFFLPHLAGERTPYMDPRARAAFTGLTVRHGRAYLVRAVMEGVVMALKQGLVLMQEIGAPIEQVVASGGGTRHPLWLQLMADIFNYPIYLTTAGEAAATGAAILAGVGTGLYSNTRQASQELARTAGEVIQPIPQNSLLYEDTYRVFSQLYSALNSPRGESSSQVTST